MKSAEYKHNKFITALEIVRLIENWPAAWTMRINRSGEGLRLLRFRSGLNLVCRGGTRDWDVIHELVFAKSYERALRHLSLLHAETTVIDLGGNIGLFSLLAAQRVPSATIEVFEPGPPNLRILEMNLLANPQMGKRIHVHREAVAGKSRVAKWFFDLDNPGGSSLFGTGETGTDVKIRSLSDVVRQFAGRIDLIKIDIEGAEYEIIEQTPAEIWQLIPALSLELHNDPKQRMSNGEFLDRMIEFGYRVEPERVCSFFLTR
ncbi:MAG: FkbM family methyltransferase [Chthoniobacterales bacterium]